MNLQQKVAKITCELGSLGLEDDELQNISAFCVGQFGAARQSEAAWGLLTSLFDTEPAVIGKVLAFTAGAVHFRAVSRSFKQAMTTALQNIPGICDALLEVDSDLQPGRHWELTMSRCLEFDKDHLVLRNKLSGLVLVLPGTGTSTGMEEDFLYSVKHDGKWSNRKLLLGSLNEADQFDDSEFLKPEKTYWTSYATRYQEMLSLGSGTTCTNPHLAFIAHAVTLRGLRYVSCSPLQHCFSPVFSPSRAFGWTIRREHCNLLVGTVVSARPHEGLGGRTRFSIRIILQPRGLIIIETDSVDRISGVSVVQGASARLLDAAECAAWGRRGGQPGPRPMLLQETGWRCTLRRIGCIGFVAKLLMSVLGVLMIMKGLGALPVLLTSAKGAGVTPKSFKPEQGTHPAKKTYDGHDVSERLHGIDNNMIQMRDQMIQMREQIQLLVDAAKASK